MAGGLNGIPRNGLVLPSGESVASAQQVAQVRINLRADGKIEVESNELDLANVAILMDKAKMLVLQQAPINLGTKAQPS